MLLVSLLRVSVNTNIQMESEFTWGIHGETLETIITSIISLFIICDKLIKLLGSCFHTISELEAHLLTLRLNFNVLQYSK